MSSSSAASRVETLSTEPSLTARQGKGEAGRSASTGSAPRRSARSGTPPALLEEPRQGPGRHTGRCCSRSAVPKG
eukprot:723456-Prymnesium_polylepis.1